MNYINIIIKEDRPNGFGFTIRDQDGKLLVVAVKNDGAALESGIQCGDKIYSINGEVIQCSLDDFVKRMNYITGEVHLLVERDYSGGQLPRSFSNCSDGLDQISSNSYEKLTTSTSSIDLNNSGSKNQILEANYVPEKHIDRFLQPMTSYEATDKFSDDSIEPPHKQVIRKQAYKKPFEIASDNPKYSVKKAIKSTSLYSKEPTFTVKRKINTKMSEVAQAVTNLNQAPRRSIEPVTSNTRPMTSNLTYPPPNRYQNIVSTLANVENMSCPVIPLSSSSLSSLSELMKMETMVKIISFKEKVKKTEWNNFLIESDSLGVWFHCLDSKETITASNSTALEPHIAGLSMFMQLWHANNNLTKFFLPIGQETYSDDMEISASADNISVKYSKYGLEFLINFSRLNEEKMVLLFSILLLKHELPEVKLQTKTKKIHESAENIKMEPRKSKPQKEPPRDNVLSNLAQTKLVENVPLFVVVCTNILERVGLRSAGIYRLSGNDAAKKRLENIVLSQSAELWSENDEWNNVNTVACLLKSMLRNYGLIDRDTAIKLSMINVCTETNISQKYMDMMYHLRQHLCRDQDLSLDTQLYKDRSLQEIRCRRDTFKYLLRHLHKISRCASTNNMGADNLAICFSPTIIEDIPLDDDDEDQYKTSKKSDADRNLKEMVKFWITNVTLICDLLDDDDEQQRFEKLTQFCEGNMDETVMELPEVDDTKTVIKDVIDLYTAQSFVPESDSGSLSMTDGGFLTKIKNTAAFQSIRRKENHPRRESGATMSPQEIRKNTVTDISVESVKHVMAAGTTKRTDNWTTKSVRTKRRGEPQIPLKKELSLTSMRLSSTVKNVPVIVDICVTILERHGLDVDGLHRVSGKKHDINILEDLVVDNKYNDLTDEDQVTMLCNLHTVSGLLKAILKRFCLIKKSKWVHLFSQLPEKKDNDKTESEKKESDDLRKVLMEAAYHLRHEDKKKKQRSKFLGAQSYGNVDQLELECEENIRMATLRFVLRHLHRVTEHSHNNRMATFALAVCFMPVLMEEDESADIVAINNKGIVITEKLIEHCDWIFQWDDKPWDKIYGQEMTDSLDEYLKKYRPSLNGGPDTRTGGPSDQCAPTHIIDYSQVHPLLERSFATSYMNAHDRFTLRRHSDDTDCATRKSEYRDSKIFDDSQLPDVFPTICGYNDSRTSLHSLSSDHLQLIDPKL